MCVLEYECVSLGDDVSLPKKQIELLSEVLRSQFFNSVKDVSSTKPSSQACFLSDFCIQFVCYTKLKHQPFLVSLPVDRHTLCDVPTCDSHTLSRNVTVCLSAQHVCWWSCRTTVNMKY